MKEQCKNRNYTPRKVKINPHKIKRINIHDENDIEIYNNIDEAIDYIIKQE